MEAFGAEVLVEPSGNGAITPELIQRMKARAFKLAEEPGSYYANQFGSPDVRAGYEPMGQEVAEAPGSGVDVLVAAVGTGAALVGTADIRAIDQEPAFQMCRELARRTGIFCGGSTGLNLVAAIEIARELGPNRRVVTLGCDSGIKYLGGHTFG